MIQLINPTVNQHFLGMKCVLKSTRGEDMTNKQLDRGTKAVTSETQKNYKKQK